MARIRTIKPEFWTSEQIAELSPLARLLFIGVWSFCDDAGRHPANYRRLKMEVFPADSLEVKPLVHEIITAGLMIEYESQGEKLWQVTGWKHQRIERKTVRFPAPPGYEQFGEPSTNGRRVVDDSSTPPRPRIGDETRRDEWNGSGMEGSLRAPTSDEARGAGDAGVGAVAQKVSEDSEDWDEIKRLANLASHEVKVKGESDRSLLLKAATLCVRRFGEHWFHDSLEAVRKAYARAKPPHESRAAYFHGVLKSRTKDLGFELNALLAAIDVAPHLLKPPERAPP